MTNPDTLIAQGRTTASLWNEYDEALDQLTQGFRTPFDASKSNLHNALYVADKQGQDFSCFQGPSSLFKFPEVDTQIVVRVRRVPTQHKDLDVLNNRIDRLKRELKVAETKRKHLIVELVLKEQIDLVTDNITTAYTRLKSTAK